jgi:hypothetical protein
MGRELGDELRDGIAEPDPSRSTSCITLSSSRRLCRDARSKIAPVKARARPRAAAE